MDKEGNKTGGRQKGTPNRRTGELRRLFADFTEQNFEQFKIDFMTMRPKDRARLYVEQLKYSVPAMKAVEHEFNPEDLSPVILSLGSGIKPNED